MSVVLALVLVLGGCCSNVISFEHILQGSSINLGNVVTFSQFLSVTVMQLPSVFTVVSQPPFLIIRRRKIPLKIHCLAVLLFFMSSVANNSVFKFDISVPLHITIRCSGTALTMLIGWAVCNKRFSKLEVFSAIIMTLGAIVTLLYRDKEFSLDTLNSASKNSGLTKKSAIGVLLMLFATALMALLSLLNEWTYKRYGKHWRETLFYSHSLALLLFIPGIPRLKEEFKDLTVFSNVIQVPFLKQPISTKLGMLFVNNMTQFVCVNGVNMLASQTDALTLSVALLTRKFISILLSAYIYKSVMSKTAYLSTTLVLFGASLYSYASKKRSAPLT
ncbi:UDP-N-acetylglucosamine transporter YEA4 [Kluyveromyces marxianus]|uniref:UDP-N-acetylglucosamine transporter YEA4 n=2 Tax=Kluyveromyces marxianus TaxID=4911 RepID=W0TCF6_KLUMD|nr:UDP-N-acetylglucosamine transporter YEA4 [Kluyveromyces marxianus DMKU3-1042]QGN16214.1 UDP-N-acetylglucosamine transporter YEA4 [Kluyveromyces marxianus]BAO40486.1 UDP-N-acetylglucosamine transporter YEA4 [Kluyveromyces marxianus DMKU3-1042]